jgi:arylsulfatase A-like enzyme
MVASRMPINLLRLVLAVALVLPWHRSMAAGQAEHVVVVVWDGMRPDYVTAQNTPTLHALATRGTFFKRHHSSYVTSTEVNGAAIATGMFPNHDGIMGNTQYRPELTWLSPYGTENFDAIRRGDLLTDGHYLEAATLPEILQQAGFRTITAGAKPVVLLHDRAPRTSGAAQTNSILLFRGQTLPRSVMQSLVDIPEIGPFPKEPNADTTRGKVVKWLRSAQNEVFLFLYGRPRTPPLARAIDRWTTRALVHGLWKDGLPKYSLLWLSEPDASQHQAGVGSENAKAGLAQCDKNLALVLKTLQDKGVLDRTDILVVSDHAFSTINEAPDLINPLKRAGFIAGKQFENPEPGDVMVVNLGGSIFFYVFAHEEQTIRRLVDYLQGSDFAGVIFSAVPVEGTFSLSQVHLNAARGAPDVVVSTHWSRERNEWGAPGLVTAPEGTRGRGTHGSLSPFDLHNTLIAAGPDFKREFASEVPSGNVDVAPTVLAILGVAPPTPTDGRVLTEALTVPELSPVQPEEQTIEASRDLGVRLWHQYLKFTRVGSAVYYDEGNGGSRLK